MSDEIDFVKLSQEWESFPAVTIAAALKKLWLMVADELEEKDLAWFAQLSITAEHRLAERSQQVKDYAELLAIRSEPLNPEAVMTTVSGFASNFEDIEAILSIANDAAGLLDD